LTFTKPGVYKYYCLIHPGMAGTITVLAAAGASSGA
jgi:plastocyanin